MPAITIHDPARPGGFSWADDTLDADRECGKRRQIHSRQCPVCKRTVMLHCSECLLQVTGCLCTMVERMGPVEAYKAVAMQVGQRSAQRQFKAQGYDMLWLPGLPD